MAGNFACALHAGAAARAALRCPWSPRLAFAWLWFCWLLYMLLLMLVATAHSDVHPPLPRPLIAACALRRPTCGGRRD